MKRIVTVGDNRYIVLGTVSANENYNPDEIKKQWGADTVLRSDNKLYITQKIVNAEFKDIKEK